MVVVDMVGVVCINGECAGKDRQCQAEEVNPESHIEESWMTRRTCRADGSKLLLIVG